MLMLRATIFLLLALCSTAEQLMLPPRPANAPTGTEFARLAERMPVAERERWIQAEILRGNLPEFLRSFVPLSFAQTLSNRNYTLQLQVLPDYLAIGTDADYLLVPMTPLLAQRLADRLGCTLPTRKMVNVIWTNAAVKLTPQTISPSAQMITMPIFAEHNALVRAQRNTRTNAFPLGALVGGHKKDVILSARIYTNFANPAITAPVVIYGWHYPSGSPIQPLYNGHEQTYADYSHGIRLVRNVLLLNGQSTQISQVLTNPALAPLLSDDSTAEGTSGGVIPVPRYAVAGFRPAVLQPPRSLRLRPQETAVLSLLAAGDPEPSWQWFQDHLPLAAGTSASLTTTGTLAQAGEYFAVVSNSFGMATSRVSVVSLNTNRWPVVFSETFDEAAASNRWQIQAGAADEVLDYQADCACDHRFTPCSFTNAFSAVPAAPGSSEGDCHALRLAVNGNDTNGSEAAVNAYPVRLPTIASNFILSFDLWINYPGGAGGVNATGSTQHALFGLGHSGRCLNWPLAKTNSDGAWFALTGEGGDTRDCRAYRGQPGTAPTDLTGPAGGMAASNNSAAVFQELFPGGAFETPGSPGKSWVQVELQKTNGLVHWLVNGRRLATLTNGAFNGSAVMLGLADLFKSIANPAPDAFVLFDNVTIEETGANERVLSCARTTGGQLEFAWSTIPGAPYVLEHSTNLLNWEFVRDVTTNRPPLNLAVPIAPGSSEYFRLRRGW